MKPGIRSVFSSSGCSPCFREGISPSASNHSYAGIKFVTVVGHYIRTAIYSLARHCENGTHPNLLRHRSFSSPSSFALKATPAAHTRLAVMSHTTDGSSKRKKRPLLSFDATRDEYIAKGVQYTEEARAMIAKIEERLDEQTLSDFRAELEQ